MTDNELKALVAGLAIAQDRTEALLAETAVRQAKHEAKQAKREAKQSKREAKQAKREAKQAKREAKHEDYLAKTEAFLAESAARQAETDAELKRLAKMFGGMGNNLGAVAEEFYHNSLKADPVLAGVRFDFIDKNVTRSRAGVEDEFDLLLVNGSEVCVVEVKHKAHESDLERLLDKKAPNFRRLFPEHAGRRQWLALAAFHIHDELKEAALAQGVTVLQRKGDVFDTLPA